MSEEHEQVSRESPRQQHAEGQGCGIINLWLVFGVSACGAVGFWLASDHGILWGGLAAVGGALVGLLVTPLVMVVLFAIIHVSIKVEDHFKPFPPSARAVRGMPTLRLADATEPPAVVCRFECEPYRRLKSVVVFLLALAGAVLLSYFALFLDRPILLRGVELSLVQARLSFGVLVLLGLIGLIALGWVVYIEFTRNRRVVLTNRSLTLPRAPCVGFSPDEIEIPLESITSVSVRDFGGSSQLLVIKHESDVATLPSDMFHKGREFAELAWVLTEAIDNGESTGRST